MGQVTARWQLITVRRVPATPPSQAASHTGRQCWSVVKRGRRACSWRLAHGDFIVQTRSNEAYCVIPRRFTPPRNTSPVSVPRSTPWTQKPRKLGTCVGATLVSVCLSVYRQVVDTNSRHVFVLVWAIHTHWPIVLGPVLVDVNVSAAVDANSVQKEGE